MTTMSRTFVLKGPGIAQALWAFLKANWKEMAREGRPLAVTVAEHKAKRSVEQNKRYWALLREISEQSWVSGRQFSDEVWHEQMKRQFIGMEELPNGDKAGISTTKLNVHEFGEYMAQVEEYAASRLGVTFSQ